MKINEFISELKKINISVSDNQLEMLDIYADYLLEYNQKVNLTAIRDKENVYLKHFFDSMLIFNNELLDFNKIETVIDVGTGAGFPGVIIKIFYPHIKLTLLDSNNKKTTFLETLVQKLKLNDVTIVNDRAENYVVNNRQKYDVSVARAVSELRIISELCLPLTKVGGYFIALKGHCEEEMKNASITIKKLNSKVEKIYTTKLPIENSIRNIIFIKNIEIIAENYPRRYEQIVKKPLK